MFGLYIWTCQQNGHIHSEREKALYSTVLTDMVWGSDSDGKDSSFNCPHTHIYVANRQWERGPCNCPHNHCLCEDQAVRQKGQFVNCPHNHCWCEDHTIGEKTINSTALTCIIDVRIRKWGKGPFKCPHPHTEAKKLLDFPNSSHSRNCLRLALVKELINKTVPSSRP